jgi:pyruvate ferredoxin oxidoreductase gamma subunit
MKETFEIRMHSKSGQGAKTVGQFIAEAALEQGKYVQAYAEFGAERIGAPMVAFARISTKPIKTHAPIAKPDMLMVFDDSLMGLPDTLSGLKADGIILINTTKKADYFKLNTKAKVYAIDATRISIGALGEARPNMPMLGAFAKLTGCIEIKAATKSIHDKWLKKLGAAKTAANEKALSEGYNAV